MHWHLLTMHPCLWSVRYGFLPKIVKMTAILDTKFQPSPSGVRAVVRFSSDRWLSMDYMALTIQWHLNRRQRRGGNIVIPPWKLPITSVSMIRKFTGPFSFSFIFYIYPTPSNVSFHSLSLKPHWATSMCNGGANHRKLALRVKTSSDAPAIFHRSVVLNLFSVVAQRSGFCPLDRPRKFSWL